MKFVRGETDVEQYLRFTMRERIMFIDGAMGTMVQVLYIVLLKFELM
jgi:methionine synthase I (cobalamin-dependent)